MEAGLEHLSWAGGTLRHVDILMIVVEPYVKALVTGTRTHTLASQLGIARVGLVANRVRPGDIDTVTAFAAAQGIEILATIPDDDDVRRADRAGRCVLDEAPDSAAVRAIESAARLLEGRFVTTPI